MGPLGCHETSVGDNQLTLLDISKGGRSQAIFVIMGIVFFRNTVFWKILNTEMLHFRYIYIYIYIYLPPVFTQLWFFNNGPHWSHFAMVNPIRFLITVCNILIKSSSLGHCPPCTPCCCLKTEAESVSQT
jgi:hypothetical protein